MASILFVRVASDAEAEELERRVVERRAQFLRVPGLVQKIYGPRPGHRRLVRHLLLRERRSARRVPCERARTRSSLSGF